MRQAAHAEIDPGEDADEEVEELAKERLAETLAFLEQAEAFHSSARGRSAAHPLLYYYSLLNVGKALLRIRKPETGLEVAHHGLKDLSARTADPEEALLKVPCRQHVAMVFPELVEALGYPRPKAGRRYLVSDLMSQVVIGHRLWREACAGDERFIALEKVAFMQDESDSSGVAAPSPRRGRDAWASHLKASAAREERARTWLSISSHRGVRGEVALSEAN